MARRGSTLVPGPIRTAAMLVKYPASSIRKVKQGGCVEAA